MRSFTKLAGFGCALLLAAPAMAADVWTDPFPGIQYLHRSTAEPKEIHALVVDLGEPTLFLRATLSAERGQNVSSFASAVGAAVAVNGDFYNTDGSYDPIGLAIGEGVQWSDGVDSASHSFIACSVYKVCEIDTTGSAVTVDPNWWSAVGGNHVIVDQGVLWSAADDSSCGSFCTTAHPRTAAGLSEDGSTLYLVVVEGRQDPIFGMPLSQLATLMDELGAYTALNLDGGGSSSMVVEGTRVSGRPSAEPTERSVANHLAVIHDPNAPTSGRLVGYVREGDIFASDMPIADALVELSTGQSGLTDIDGFYDFPDVVPGVVNVSASKDGYLPASDSKEVVGGITNWKSVALQLAPDAGVVDAAQSDAALPDATPPDSAVADVERPDTARPDTLQPDRATGVDGGAGVDTARADVPTGTDVYVVTFPDAGAEGEGEPEGGCGCRAAAAGNGGWILLLVAIAAYRRQS